MKWSHLHWSEVQLANDVALHPRTETSTFNTCWTFLLFLNKVSPDKRETF